MKKKTVLEFISNNELKSATDVQDMLKDLFKDVIREMLNVELAEDLGYEKNQYVEYSQNYRNGYSKKALHSSKGDICLDIPRDRKGTFELIVVEKGSKYISNIEQKIIRMYAGRMSNQNIYEEMQELYGIKVTSGMVTAITDEIILEIREWQKRQVEEQYVMPHILV